jgi:cyclophilin family peptidyl-prolyl cis-trans isomerase
MIGMLSRTTVWMAAAIAALGLQTARAQDAAASEQKEETMPKTVYVVMETSMGAITLALNNEKAPISVANFLKYADEGHYDGTIFHRVIENFMIQGGGFTPDMSQKETGEGIKNEWKNGLSNTRGTIAMARLGYQPDSGTAQFFINVADNDFLDKPRDGAGYAVFGKVAQGMDVVDAIRAVKTTSKPPHDDVPVEPVVIQKVRRASAEETAELEKAAAKAEG